MLSNIISLIVLHSAVSLDLAPYDSFSVIGSNPNYHFSGSNLFDVNFKAIPGAASAGAASYQSPFQSFQQGTNPFQFPFQTTTPDPRTLTCAIPPASCPPTKYRSLDGSCNNLRNPGWGTPQTTFNRLLPPNYGDGISTPPRSKSGNELPNSRILSLILYPDVPIKDPKFTLAAMQYGQIITHDMSMIAGSTQAQPHSTQCCSPDGQLLPLANSPEHCFPIVLPKDDPINVNYQANIGCMNFLRTITDRDRNCVGGLQPAEQITVVNAFVDLSIVYGNTDQIGQQVREFNGGRLRAEFRQGQEWLPRNNNATGVCMLQSIDEVCYLAGDARVNQNPQLTVLQIILFREHNRIADALAKLNPHWDDERLYQEARRIAIAEHQFITFYEWVPIFAGVENSLKNRIVYDTKGFVDDYDESVDPSILNEYTTAAFRFFHSLIAGHLDLVSEYRQSYGNLRLSDWFNRPSILEQGTNFDDLTRGLGSQPELKSDRFHDSEITQFLFRMGQFGQDLKAIDIHRNRDHGLATYNSMRQFCGLSKARSFEDFADVMARKDVETLASLYETPDDVDLTVGGSLELLVPGTLAGPTFLCILTEQFYRTRVGDRFWFEHGDGTGFTLAQLNEIRKTSISRLFCDNTDVQSMQPHGFEKISSSNPVVPCSNLQFVDLSLWKEDSLGLQQPVLAAPPHDILLGK